MSVVRYGVVITEWTKQEFQSLGRKTKKMLAKYGARYPKADVDRLYAKRSKGGRGRISMEDCVEMEENSLEKYFM